MNNKNLQHLPRIMKRTFDCRFIDVSYLEAAAYIFV